jgi:hypothetical protein
MIVDLFPYKIKNRNNFLFNEHPDLIYNSPKYNAYWGKQIARCIEGAWINDEGAWVWMPPKLYFYINIFLINTGKGRRLTSPTLNDKEFLHYTYLICSIGFSGFSDDNEYSCFELLQKGTYTEFEEGILRSKNVWKKNGELKTYVDSWTYLTRHYLIDHPADKPLGVPLYDNPIRDAMIFGSRGYGKSLMENGDLWHDFLTGGVRDIKDVQYMNKSRMLYFVGAPNSDKKMKFMQMGKIFYYNMPGSGKEENQKSPFYRRLMGSWDENKLQHEIVTKSRDRKGSGSFVQHGVFADKIDAAVGDRYVKIIIEECGLESKLLEIQRITANSLKAEDEKIGQFVYIGTSGEMDYVDGSKTLFYNTELYDIFGIPNYWQNPAKKIALFVPSLYSVSKFKDANGNTNLEEAYKYRQAELEDKIRNNASQRDLMGIKMGSPIEPSDMFVNLSMGDLPSDLASRRRSIVETEGLFDATATIGEIYMDGEKRAGLRPDKSLNVIKSYFSDNTKLPKDKNGWCIYEMPIENPPHGLYTIYYDPVRFFGEGNTRYSSMCSAVVYKFPNIGDGRGLSDDIVACKLWRHKDLDENHMEVIKAAIFYKANIIYEIIDEDFISFCIRKGYTHLLKPTPEGGNVIKIKGSLQQRCGVKIDDVTKTYGIKRLNEWLSKVTLRDEEGSVLKRKIDSLNDLRILDEIANYSETSNFDYISAMILMAIDIHSKRETNIKADKNGKASSSFLELINFTKKKSLGNYW